MARERDRRWWEELGLYMNGLDSEASKFDDEARRPQGPDGLPRGRLTHRPVAGRLSGSAA
ncbi:hypothetical protein STANM309S_04167 [Streptomyces tanashiensis]